ncbi:MAG: radical SAM protein, partial [Phycisphaerae bacterium]|nr:radical SAM protein [Phycisphaerae bacterium]
RCNLKCRHCYSSSSSAADPDELTTDEAASMIDDLARFGVPVLLFSGGEPLLRPDLLQLVARARQAGLRAVLSTNGTLITDELAESLAEADLNYVGVSLDGLAETNDAFRGLVGAFDRALDGIRKCRDVGIKVGLRLTMNQGNVDEIAAIFDLIERENIPRVCFYHLVHTGRGEDLRDCSLTHAQTRRALVLIMDRTAALHAAEKHLEVLTVDNHADGPYLYLRLLRTNPVQAEQCLALLRAGGGNSSGIGIGCVSWNGDVLPDQFCRQHVLGNVRRQAFSKIWADPTSDESGLLAKLRNRKEYLKRRCRYCRFLDVCNGNLRARAEAATGDLWGDDPACYLTDEEITS